MFRWFLLISILVIPMTIQAEEFTFIHDREKLKVCIEDNLLKNPLLKNDKNAEIIAEILSKRFVFKSFTEKQFNKAVENIYYMIRNKKSSILFDNGVTKKLQIIMKIALKMCTDKTNLPRFVNEPQVLADLLDYILVDWPIPLKEMISNHEGRSTLRLYAYATGVRLMAALRYFSMDSDVFHRELLKIWMLRARHFYDGRGNEVPYLRHRFTTDSDRTYSSITLDEIHTIDNINSFVARSSENFQRRNPTFDRWNPNQVATILDLQSFFQNFPESSISISGAEYYLQTHIVRCYKIIIFILELQFQGINTDEDDIYEGPVPSDLVPLTIQRIVWDGVAYRNYLTSWCQDLRQFSREQLKEFYSREDLIMLLTLMIIRKNSGTRILTTTAPTTTTTTSTTESPGYVDVSKEGEVHEQDCRKYFLPKKRFRSMFPELNQEQPKRFDSHYKDYGYIECVKEFN